VGQALSPANPPPFSRRWTGLLAGRGAGFPACNADILVGAAPARDAAGPTGRRTI